MERLRGNISKFFAWIMVSIVIVSLAGFGIQNIIAQVPKGWKSFLGFEIICIALLEIFFVAPTIVPIPTTKVTIPEHYYTLANEPDNLAVFDYPT